MAKSSLSAPTIANRAIADAFARARSEGQMSDAVGPQTTPSRIRWLTVISLLAVAAMFVTVTVAIGQAREGFQVIGHGAGPQMAATSNLYYALSDMDAQVANVLLMGDEHDLGEGRDAALDLYEERRADANRALTEAAQLAEDDSAAQRNVRDVMDGLGSYEQLVAEARSVNDEEGGKAGPPPGEVVDVYREATSLMKLELLPKAYNLTLDSGATVRATYEEKRDAVLSALAWTAVIGLSVVGMLVALHTYLSRRFRRRVNPPLALAVALASVLTVGACTMLATEAGQMRTAKEDGLDSVLSLARARAISTSMHGDQSRYLLDPKRADHYEQVYLDGARMVLYVPSGNVDGYSAQVNAAVDAYPNEAKEPMQGFLGEESRDVTLEGQRAHLRKVLAAYNEFQQSDKEMRDLAEDGETRDAIEARMGGEGSADETFDSYDRELVALTRLHRAAFDDAVAAGDSQLAGWDWQLPVACLSIAVLVVIGVYPRLAEYR